MKRRDVLLQWLAAACATGARASGANGSNPEGHLPPGFERDNSTPPKVDLGSSPYVPQSTILTASRTNTSKRGNVLSVKDCGAKGDGVNDDTASIQEAVDSRAAVIRFPAGSYRISDTISVTQNRTILIGDGKQITKVIFEPKNDAPCFSFSNGRSVLYQAAIRGFGFVGAGTTQKVGIRATDTSEFSVEDIAMYPWKGDSSIGIQLRGRELTRIHNVSISADLPISIEDNPNSSIDLDHAHFSDCYLLPGATEPCIRVQSGLHLTNIIFDGYQAWVGGAGGFFWNDVDSRAVSLDLSFQNVRYEQAVDRDAYAIAIRHNHELQGLTIRNTNLGILSRGVFLRGCRRVTLENVSYSSPRLEAVNFDTSCDEILFLNCFFQAGSTASMSALENRWSLHKHPAKAPLPSTAFWSARK